LIENWNYYKSREDFAAKMARGLATPGKDGRATREEVEWEAFERQFTLVGEYDDAALRLVDAFPDASAPDARAAEWNTQFAAFADDIARCAASGDISQALRILRRCLRYHDCQQAWLIGAKLSLLADERAACLAYLARLLREPDSQLREQGYRCLMECYRASGEQAKADGIAAELQPTSPK
jgi:hypothetical protein